MKIINPIYDEAFKYLMQNEEHARKVLSVILNTEIKAISMGKQKIVCTDKSKLLSVLCLGFKATMLQENGEEKTVFIELQKLKNPQVLYWPRHYLGRQYYFEEDEYVRRSNYNIYPIVTISLLGYNLPSVPQLMIKSERALTNLNTGEPVDIDDSFFEHTPQESYLIQIRRLPVERKTRLEHFLTLFNQARVAEKDYLLDLEEVPEEFAEIARYLHEPVPDERFHHQLELEWELARHLEEDGKATE